MPLINAFTDVSSGIRARSNIYTMGCPPVRGDNPRALVSGLSYVQVDRHGIIIYITYISIDLAHHEIFRAKVGKGGINILDVFLTCFSHRWR